MNHLGILLAIVKKDKKAALLFQDNLCPVLFHFFNIINKLKFVALGKLTYYFMGLSGIDITRVVAKNVRSHLAKVL